HEQLYASNYSDQQLEEWANKIRKWNEKGMDVYVYFDNDANAYAVRNALKLKELLR
ncbi:MAG: sensor histidine kinase, partial [Candidatus Altiarchaeales archaeon ex4484_43]